MELEDIHRIEALVTRDGPGGRELVLTLSWWEPWHRCVFSDNGDFYAESLAAAVAIVNSWNALTPVPKARVEESLYPDLFEFKLESTLHGDLDVSESTYRTVQDTVLVAALQFYASLEHTFSFRAGNGN